MYSKPIDYKNKEAYEATMEQRKDKALSKLFASCYMGDFIWWGKTERGFWVSFHERSGEIKAIDDDEFKDSNNQFTVEYLNKKHTKKKRQLTAKKLSR